MGNVTFDEQDAAARAASYRGLYVAIARTLAEYIDVDRAMERVLELMGTALGWEFGIYWLPDAEARSLSCAAAWSDPSVDLTEFEADTRTRVFAMSEGVLGAAWERGESRWISDIEAEAGFLRAELARRAGLRSAVLVPILSGPKQHPHALIEFLRTQVTAEDEDLMEVLRTMSIFVHQYVRLRSAEQALQRLVSADVVDDVVIDQLETARRALQRTDEANELLAMASHELRTPLTSIVGFTSTMLELGDQLDGEQKRQYLEIVNAQTLRLQRLVDDLHLFSRVESGRLPIQAEELDVGTAIRQTVRDLGVEGVEIACPPGVLARADRHHLQQILANYLSNAMKYGGGAPITIEAYRAEGSIVIAVCDQGTGVAAQFVPKLFERFARDVDPTDVAGTGLGLSIVRGLARAQGGDAWYEPNEPRGSRFCVRLPHSIAS